MSVGELHHVVVSVSDMDRSLTFYRDGLGLRKTLDIEVSGEDLQRMLAAPPGMRGRTVYVQGPSRIGQVELVEWRPMLEDATPPKRIGEPGVTVLSFPVEREELVDLYDHLQALGFECVSEPGTTVLDDYGEIAAFLVRDPDGNLVELVSLPSDEEVRRFRAESRSSDATETEEGTA